MYTFIGKVAADYPRINIFGICFGQQAVAMALGGTCEPNVKGWEVGTYDVELTGPGKLIFGRDILVRPWSSLILGDLGVDSLGL